MSKPRGDPSCGTSSEDVLIATERHPAYRQREARSGSGTERENLFPGPTRQKAMYDFLNDNPAVASAPVNYVNDPRIIAQNDNVISINATIQIDLTGACNSEHMLGHQYSASGGQLDFVRGAYASKGGKSIIATRSTAAEGKISRIVPRLEGRVTTPRIDAHYIVTEFGSANLK